MAFNLFGQKGSKKGRTPQSTEQAVPTRPRTSVKEILDMQDLKDDLPTQFAKSTKAKEATANRVNTPMGVDPKALAKAAAARIDQIEREMSLDLRGADASKLPSHPRANEIAQRAGFIKVALPPGMQSQVPIEPDGVAFRPAVSQATGIMPENSTNMVLGNTSLSDVIDVKESTVAPSVEESAVLYANGQLDEAITLLKDAFRTPEILGASEFNAYRMLMDLLRIKGDFDTFEAVAMDFVMRFEKSPPSWNVLPKVDEPVVLSAVPTIDLGEILDISIVPVLEQLKVLAQNSNVLRMDASHISMVNTQDGFGCELMLRVIQAFEKADYQLEVVGIPNLVSVLKPKLVVGDKSVSTHVWLLYLELLRMVNQPKVFEDRAIEFTVTFEMSPPSWEPPSVKIKASKVDDQPPMIMQLERSDHLFLKGEVLGDGQVLVNEIAKGLQDHQVVVCDCTQLQRVEFSVAAKLLTALTYWTAENKTVEFRNLNHPIAALFVTLGVNHMAVVERRRDA